MLFPLVHIFFLKLPFISYIRSYFVCSFFALSLVLKKVCKDVAKIVILLIQLYSFSFIHCYIHTCHVPSFSLSLSEIGVIKQTVFFLRLHVRSPLITFLLHSRIHVLDPSFSSLILESKSSEDRWKETFLLSLYFY